MFPSHGALNSVFASQHPLTRPQTPPQTQTTIKRQPFTAWSAVDNIKETGHKISEEVRKDYEKASQKAQGKAGKIELYSGKYYAACTFGGLLACVSSERPMSTGHRILISSRA
jgi:solute carrier family 25 phosphate transporter 3